MIIPLDPNLKPQRPRRGSQDRAAFIGASFLGASYSGGQHIQANEFVSDTLAAPEGVECFYQAGTLAYLEHAYNCHYGVVIRPDMLWYDLLCELAGIVKKSPDLYREKFTTSSEKKTVSIQSGSLTEMPLEDLAAALRQVVPSNVELFFINFSTTEEDGKKAAWAAFADMVSPYYSYEMYMCGIPYVDLRGTLEDWQKFETLATTVIFPMFLSCEPELAPFFEKWATVLSMIRGTLDRGMGAVLNGTIMNDEHRTHFWKGIFKSENVGSGGDTLVDGWFTHLFREQPLDMMKAANFALHVSQVEYRQVQTEKDFIMSQGIMRADVEGDLLVPRYAQVIVEKLKAPRVLPKGKFFEIVDKEAPQEGGKPTAPHSDARAIKFTRTVLNQPSLQRMPDGSLKPMLVEEKPGVVIGNIKGVTSIKFESEPDA